jgi:hypothetical protein
MAACLERFWLTSYAGFFPSAWVARRPCRRPDWLGATDGEVLN